MDLRLHQFMHADTFVRGAPPEMMLTPLEIAARELRDRIIRDRKNFGNFLRELTNAKIVLTPAERVFYAFGMNDEKALTVALETCTNEQLEGSVTVRCGTKYPPAVTNLGLLYHVMDMWSVDDPFAFHKRLIERGVKTDVRLIPRALDAVAKTKFESLHTLNVMSRRALCELVRSIWNRSGEYGPRVGHEHASLVMRACIRTRKFFVFREMLRDFPKSLLTEELPPELRPEGLPMNVVTAAVLFYMMPFHVVMDVDSEWRRACYDIHLHLVESRICPRLVLTRDEEQESFKRTVVGTVHRIIESGWVDTATFQSSPEYLGYRAVELERIARENELDAERIMTPQAKLRAAEARRRANDTKVAATNASEVKADRLNLFLRVLRVALATTTRIPSASETKNNVVAAGFEIHAVTTLPILLNVMTAEEINRPAVAYGLPPAHCSPFWRYHNVDAHLEDEDREKVIASRIGLRLLAIDKGLDLDLRARRENVWEDRLEGSAVSMSRRRLFAARLDKMMSYSDTLGEVYRERVAKLQRRVEEYEEWKANEAAMAEARDFMTTPFQACMYDGGSDGAGGDNLGTDGWSSRAVLYDFWCTIFARYVQVTEKSLTAFVETRGDASHRKVAETGVLVHKIGQFLGSRSALPHKIAREPEPVPPLHPMTAFSDRADIEFSRVEVAFMSERVRRNDWDNDAGDNWRDDDDGDDDFSDDDDYV